MITVTQYPSQLTPIYNPIVFVATSTNTAQENFRYVVDVYINVAFYTRLIVPPNPSNDSLYVNLAPVLEPLVSQDVDKPIDDNTDESNTNSSIMYTVKFGEQYGASGDIFSDLVTVSNLYAWNSIFDYEDFVDYSSGDYQMSASTLGQFLTNRPSSGDVYVDDNAWLYWVKLFNSGSFYSRVITYDSSGSVIANRIINMTNNGRLGRMPTGPDNINNLLNAIIISGGNQPIITASVAKYSIQLFSDITALIPISQIYYYTIASGCSDRDKVNVVFLNKLGGYDSFAFIKASKRTASIERKEFKSSMGSFQSFSTFTYSKSDRATTQYHTKIKDIHSVESDWITEEQSVWLEELITSPDVYIDNGSELVPIVVTNSNYERKFTVNEKLFNLRLEYKYSYERYRQRR